MEPMILRLGAPFGLELRAESYFGEIYFSKK